MLRSHRVFLLFGEVLGTFPGVKLGAADWCCPASIQNEPHRGSSLDILFLLDEDIQKVVKNPILTVYIYIYLLENVGVGSVPSSPGVQRFCAPWEF